MTTQPYASEDRVFWIIDNGSSHRGAVSTERMARAWPNAQLIHIPEHASWLDQAELYFSVVQRKVVIPNDFTDLDQIRDRLAAFETRYNAIARPFNWTFTRTDLAACSAASTPATTPSPAPWRHELHPRRTYGRDH